MTDTARARRRLLVLLLVVLAAVVVFIGSLTLRSEPSRAAADPLWTARVSDVSVPLEAHVAGATVAVFTGSTVEYLDKVSGVARRSVPFAAGHTTRVLAGTRLVLGQIDDENRSGQWRVVDMATGEDGFGLRRGWDDGASLQEVVTDKALAFVRCAGQSCDVVAYGLADGSELWSGKVCGTENSLLPWAGTSTAVFTGCAPTPVDLNTGASPAWAPVIQPRFCQGVLFDLGEPGVFKRLDPATGAEMWRATWSDCGGVGGLLHDDDGSRVLDLATGAVYPLPSGEKLLTALDGVAVAASGRTLTGNVGGSRAWTVDLGSGSGELRAVAGDGTVLVGDGTKSWAVNVLNGETWELPGENPVAVEGGLVLTVTPDGQLRARIGW
ncbi:hypothetical protein Afil01_25000 [Actinorhabdospora filicis]|uniref:Uncharacterized protein n=1 Tax=Actinorhabdospora filicis TaxID=1785913 RepID=A0A9W6W966_9ACTN|nr:hypothetical protein [Actinorhabdospora filicis]GLZ77693.1 hypothetical protein Afil01_25000 [Actinorhabdospora filicis]